MWKRWVGMMCSLLLSLGITMGSLGSASAAAVHPKYTIGITLLSLQYPFLDTLYKAAQQQATKLGVRLIGLDPRQSVATELADVQDLIQKHVNAIIMIPVSYQASVAAARLANKAHIPLFLCNTVLAPNSGAHYISYIGSLDKQAGEIQGTFTVMTLRGHGNIIYLVTQFGGSSTQLRLQGFNQVLRDYPQIHILQTLQGQGSRSKGKIIMEDLLAKYKPGQIQGVVAQNDEMAIGALEAINAAHERKYFKLIMGIDGEPAAIPLVRSGAMTATVFQNAVAQGQGAITTAVSYLQGKSVSPLVDIPFQLVWTDTVNSLFPTH